MGRSAGHVDVRIEVEVEHDPGINTPDAYELPYDYVVVSLVTVLDNQLVSEFKDLLRQSIEDTGFDEDSLVRAEVYEVVRREDIP